MTQVFNYCVVVLCPPCLDGASGGIVIPKELQQPSQQRTHSKTCSIVLSCGPCLRGTAKLPSLFVESLRYVQSPAWRAELLEGFCSVCLLNLLLAGISMNTENCLSACALVSAAGHLLDCKSYPCCTWNGTLRCFGKTRRHLAATCKNGAAAAGEFSALELSGIKIWFVVVGWTSM